MVDMSHYDKEENLAKTKELVALCHEQGIATEAEPGRIEGGEDGVCAGDGDLRSRLDLQAYKVRNVMGDAAPYRGLPRCT